MMPQEKKSSRLTPAEFRNRMVELAIRSIEDLPPNLSSLEIHAQVTDIFDCVLSSDCLESGDEGPILDCIVSHFGLTKNHRFEYSQLWRETRSQYLNISPANEISNINLEELRAESSRRKNQFILPDKLITTAPGLVGEIASWITETAPKPQPILSLASSLAAVGVLKAHRVQTETGLRTNHFILGLCEAGGGKEHPLKAVDLLIRQAGLQNLVLGIPKSDTALFRAMKRARGKGLILWDEIGQSMKRVLSPYAPPHEKKVIESLLSVWGKAGGYYVGDDFADEKNVRVEIDQPCLCLYGTSVPGRFFESLSAEFIADGFLPRFLVMQVKNSEVEEREIRVLEDAPEHLIKAVSQTAYLPQNVRARGNLDEINKIRPAIIEMTAEAKELLKEIREDYKSRKRESREEGQEAIWIRAAEHVAKVALTVCDEEQISKRHLQWSYDLVTRCLEASCEAYGSHVAGNLFEKQVNKIKNIISQTPGVTRSEILRYTRLSTVDVQRVIDFLLESDTVVSSKKEGKGAGRKADKFYLSAKK